MTKRTGVIRGNTETNIKCSNPIRSNDAMFVGLDLSLTGTGLIVLDQDACIIEQRLIKTKKSDFKNEEERFVYIIDQLSFIPNIIRLQKVYIEGPSFASKGQSILQMGALNFLVRVFLYRKDIEFKIIPPKTLKKFHCGFGNTKKEDVIDKVKETLGVQFDDHNLADAYGLARMALEDYKNEQT